jgi:hypothetical protein
LAKKMLIEDGYMGPEETAMFYLLLLLFAFGPQIIRPVF